MCGICCAVSLSVRPPESCLLQEKIQWRLRRRGPDSSQQLVKAVLHPPYQCLFSGHVLHLRGPKTLQPLEDPVGGNVFLWNGELFGGIPIEGEENDTQVMFHQLCSCSSELDILSVLSSIRGPWSFIFYQASKHCLWFGRDYFGRRSLLWQFNEELEKALVLTSVSAISKTSNSWQEVPALGIFKMELQVCAVSKAVALTLYPWTCSSRKGATEEAAIIDVNVISKELPTYVSLTVNDFHSLIAPVVPLNKEVLDVPEESHFSDFTNNKADVGILRIFLAEHRKKKLVHQFIDVISTAVRRRVLYLVRDTVQLREDVSASALRKANVAVLFSGGIDSMVIATLADRHVPLEEPIDLLNVAFKIPSQGRPNSSTRKQNKEKKQLPPTQQCLDDTESMTHGSLSCFNVPDRITGRAGLEELKAINPSRSWNFVEINVTLEDLKAMRQQHISHLVYPLDTVLDDSIGCAMWFASRGEGLVLNYGDTKPYKSPAKV